MYERMDYNRVMDKKKLLDHAYEAYGAKPEYLWKRYPDYCVLRHAGNRKWFAVVMDVPRASLGLQGEGKVPILNVKCEPLLIGSLLKKRGYLPAWHMNKENWISIMLGAVPDEELIALLEMSFGMTE